MNILIAKPLSDIAILEGSMALGANSIDRLKKMQLFRFWRSTLNETFISIDFGEATEIDFIGLIGHSGTSAGTITIKAGSTKDVSDYTLSGLDLLNGVDLGYEKNLFAVKLPEEQTYRYWKIEIDDSTNPKGYIDVGRLYMDKCFVPEVNASYGAEIGHHDSSRIKRTISGAGIPLERKKLRRFSFLFDFLSEDEAFDVLFDLDAIRGQSKDVLFIFDIEETKHFQRKYIYGTMEDNKPIDLPFYNIYRKQYTITEI